MKYYFQVNTFKGQEVKGWDKIEAKQLFFALRQDAIDFGYNLSRFFDHSEVRMTDNEKLEGGTYLKSDRL